MTDKREGVRRAWASAPATFADTPFGRHSSALADAAPLQRSSIVKKLNPDQKGAQRLAERFGDHLVCVRYRTDPASGTVQPSPGPTSARFRLCQMLACHRPRLTMLLPAVTATA